MKTTVLAMLSALALALVAAPGVAAESDLATGSGDGTAADQGCTGVHYEHHILGKVCIGYHTGTTDGSGLDAST